MDASLCLKRGLLAASLFFSSALIFAEEQKRNTAPEIIIKVDNKNEISWSGGPWIEIRGYNSAKQRVSGGVFKMTKHIGNVERISIGPKILNTRATWIAYTELGPHICGVEIAKFMTVCAIVPELSKEEVAQKANSEAIAPEFELAIAKVEEGLMLKDFNDALKGLKPDEKYKPFADGSAVAQINAWRVSRGYFDQDEKIREYFGMERGVLGELAAKGDLRALSLLSAYAKEPESKNRLYTIAAQYGSTRAIMTMGDAILRQVDMRALKYEEQKVYVMKVLSYYEMARLRGDSFGAIEGKHSLLVRYKGVVLQPEDELAIKVTAQSMYDDLKERRSRLGLGEFDNSVPDVVKTYFELRGGASDQEEETKS